MLQQTPYRESFRNSISKPSFVREHEVHSLPVDEKKSCRQIRSHIKQEVAKRLTKSPDRLPSAYIGFGGLINLDYFALSRSTIGILGDINAEQEKYWNEVLSIIRESDTPEAFVRTYNHHIKEYVDATLFRFTSLETGELLDKGVMLREFKDEKLTVNQEDFSFLSDTKAYDFIHNAAITSHIIPATIDVCDTHQLEDIEIWLKDHRINMNTIYLSNIEEWLSHAKDPKQCNLLMRDNISKIAADNAIIYRVPESGDDKPAIITKIRPEQLGR